MKELKSKRLRSLLKLKNKTNLNPILIIFIDAFPFLYKNEIIDYISKINYSAKLRPELGYSSNQHWAMFSELLPDDLGYFTDWNFQFESNNLNEKNILYLKHNNIVNFLINYPMNKLGLFESNIPVGLKKYFFNKAIYPLSNNNNFKKLNSEISSLTLYKTKKSNEMEMISGLTKKGLDKRSFVVINSLDQKGHMSNTKKSSYINFLRKLLIEINDLINAFVEIYGDNSKIALLSDHGMSPVKKGVDLTLENEFGRQSPNRYLYFLDSVICRIWTKDHKFKSEIKTFLNQKKFGKVINNDERIRYQITNKKFGDIVFILNEGYVFKPNFFGLGLRGLPSGMHGYNSESNIQSGVISSNIDIFTKKKYRNIEVLETIRKLL